MFPCCCQREAGELVIFHHKQIETESKKKRTQRSHKTSALCLLFRFSSRSLRFVMMFSCCQTSCTVFVLLSWASRRTSLRYNTLACTRFFLASKRASTSVGGHSHYDLSVCAALQRTSATRALKTQKGSAVLSLRLLRYMKLKAVQASHRPIGETSRDATFWTRRKMSRGQQPRVLCSKQEQKGTRHQ